jgi:hypothetical protein
LSVAAPCCSIEHPEGIPQKEQRKMSKSRRSRRTSIDRRDFVKRVATAGIAAPLLEMPAGHDDRTTTATASARHQRNAHATEQLIGIELNDAQETMALRGVNQNLNTYESP